MKKILIVEDESKLRHSIEEILSKEGYTILSAADGEEGLQLAKDQMPDIILLDLILPKKDGFSMLQELKGSDDTQKIPVVVLSNLSEVEEVGRALELGANRYFVKTDYTVTEVVKRIKEILEEE